MLSIKKTYTIGSKLLYVLVPMVILLGIATANTRVFAADEIFTGGDDKVGFINTEIPIDDVFIDGVGDEELSINIYVPRGTIMMTDIGNLSSYTEGRVITATGLRSDLNTALASLTYTGEEYGDTIMTISIVEQEGDVYNPENGHIYRIIPAAGEGIDWHDATLAAENEQYDGQSGYLATLTDELESVLILHNLTGDAWVGGSDENVYTGDDADEWYWATGPDAGTHFWSGGPDGEASSEDTFINWISGAQPDNDQGNEGCMELAFDHAGSWNDIECTRLRSYYVVEFGGGGDDLSVVRTHITIATIPDTVEVTTCEDLREVDEYENPAATIEIMNDIDCEGEEFEPLYSSTPFSGTLNGNGYAIRNIEQNGIEYRGGLFAELSSATVRDLTIENISLGGEEGIGGLAGLAWGDLTLENIHVRDLDIDVVEQGEGAIGGLIGEFLVEDNHEASIYNVSATGKITARGATVRNVGGLIGFAINSGFLDVSKAYADVNIVTGVSADPFDYSRDIGGLFGQLKTDGDDGGDPIDARTRVEDVYAWGNIKSVNGEDVGGLFGRIRVQYVAYEEAFAHFELRRAYALGNTTGRTNVGGLIGYLDEADNNGEDDLYTITSSFTVGRVMATGEEDVKIGAIIGEIEAPSTQVFTDELYFDQIRTGLSWCNSGAESDGCVAVNISGNQPTYFAGNTENAPLDGWDFDDVWVMNEGALPTFEPYEIGSDWNADFRSDDDQANIISLTSPGNGKRAVLDIGDTCAITSVGLLAESSLGTNDPEYDYAGGLFDFSGNCSVPGFSTTVRILYYDEDGDDFVARKLNTNTNSYSTIETADISKTTLYGSPVTVVTYTLADGGELDMDGIANGRFEDPVGLAYLASTTTNQDLADTGSSLWTALLLTITLLGGGFILATSSLLVNKSKS